MYPLCVTRKISANLVFTLLSEHVFSSQCTFVSGRKKYQMAQIAKSFDKLLRYCSQEELCCTCAFYV